MIHLIKLRNGDSYEISQDKRDVITGALCGPREERPDYIEISSGGPVLSVSAIISISSHKQEPQHPPTHDEEIARFNEEWEKEHMAEN